MNREIDEQRYILFTFEIVCYKNLQRKFFTSFYLKTQLALFVSIEITEYGSSKRMKNGRKTFS